MVKSKDILRRKSQISDPLSASVEDLFAEIENNIDKKNEIEVIEKNGKKVIVFNDPLYSREPRSTVNYSIFRGKWEFEPLEDIDENDSDKCAIQFKPLNDSTEFIIAFKSMKDRVEFMNSIYADEEMKQVGNGMSLEKFANSKVLKTTGGLLGLTMAGYGLYKMFAKKDSVK
ncbi:MAG TPA: hypothetical protein DHV28_08620 [Ignavibacteriales bacterium]|nr:hypothetical protein [Ignavibacteriales bacterium]